MRDVQVGLVLVALFSSAACSLSSGSGEDPNKILDPLFGDGAVAERADSSATFDGDIGPGLDGSAGDSSTMADAGPPPPPPGGCDPSAVSAAACFTAGNISCFGVGGGDAGASTTCECMVMCRGCMFDYRCMNNSTETCSNSASAAPRGSPTGCSNACASTTNAAAEMGTIKMCGGFTSP